MEATKVAGLMVTLQWLRLRRHTGYAQAIALRGGVGVAATMAYTALNNDLPDAQSFWQTARYLLATYGAYEAYQLVRFNMDAMRYGVGGVDQAGGPDAITGEVLRPASRMLLQSNWFSDGAQFPVFSVSGRLELAPLLAVMAMALLVERLGLRRQLNRTPLTLLGLYALTNERPVTRNRR